MRIIESTAEEFFNNIDRIDEAGTGNAVDFHSSDIEDVRCIAYQHASPGLLAEVTAVNIKGEARFFCMMSYQRPTGMDDAVEDTKRLSETQDIELVWATGVAQYDADYFFEVFSPFGIEIRRIN